MTNQPDQERLTGDIKHGEWIAPYARAGRSNELECEKATRLEQIAEVQAEIETEWGIATTTTDPSELLPIIERFETRRTMIPMFHTGFCLEVVRFLIGRARHINTPVKAYLASAQRHCRNATFQTALVFYCAARKAAKSIDELVDCYIAWRCYPQMFDRADGQAYCLREAEKMAVTVHDHLSLAECWSALGSYLESTTPIVQRLRKAEKSAATPAEMLDCGTAALLVLPQLEGTRTMKRIVKKAVTAAESSKDWGCLAGAFMEEGDCGLGVMAGWRARFDQIRGVPFTASAKPDVAVLGESRRAEEQAATTVEHLRALSIYLGGVTSGQAGHFERVMAKAEARAKSALDFAACALARYDGGWTTMRRRIQTAKRALQKGIALAQEPGDWEALAAASLIIAEHMRRTEKGLAT